MSRAINHRFRITGRLVAVTPISVAGLDGASTADMELAVNGRGQFYVPGTSLAGPMRAWFFEVFCKGPTEALWGRTPARNSKDEGHASYVTVEDAVVVTGAEPEIRDGVGIDRVTGTAAQGFKFDRQVLPKGTALCFGMTVEAPHKNGLPDNVSDDSIDAAVRGIAQLLHAMQDGAVRLGGAKPVRLRRRCGVEMQGRAIRLGGAKTRGLGRLSLKDLRIERDELGTRDGVLARLKGGASKVGGIELIDPDHEKNARSLGSIRIAITWRADGPVMMKSGEEGLTIDMLPLMSSDGEKLVQVLTGAGIKGVLSAHSERICRTLFDPRDTGIPDDLLKQLEARHPLVQLLYGAGKKKENRNNGERGLGLGALSVDDCYGDVAIEAARWRKLLSAERGNEKSEGAFRPAGKIVEDAGLETRLRPAAHVAIDRWTGGAADGALYSVLEPIDTKWGPIELTIDPRRLLAIDPKHPATSETRALAAVTLLILTLRDLARGSIPLGFAGNRGMGAVVVKSIAVTTAGNFPTELKALEKLALTITDFAGLDQNGPLKLFEEAWLSYQKSWPETAPAAASEPVEAAP